MVGERTLCFLRKQFEFPVVLNSRVENIAPLGVPGRTFPPLTSATLYFRGGSTIRRVLRLKSTNATSIPDIRFKVRQVDIEHKTLSVASITEVCLCDTH